MSRNMRIKNKPALKKGNDKHLLTRRQCAVYDPEFKKIVVLYAEQKTNKEARRKFGISESNIRRWRRIKNAGIHNLENGITKNGNNPKKKEDKLDDVNTILDSMPLEQRLKAPTAEQEAILQSQPLSPTKLKVTRQTKPSQPSPKSPTPPPPTEEVCLKWNSHHSNMQHSFPNLLLREQYVDATLVADGQTLKCHRVILSSCSPYFEDILASISPNQHPVVFMKDVPFWILKSLCDFMYSGEVHIMQNKLEELLAIADILKIKGLAGTTDNASNEIKTEIGKPIKEERKDESELLEEAKKKDLKEPRKKDDKDVKKKEEIKEFKDKKRPQPAPPPEMPILKSAKLSKVSPNAEMPILQSTKTRNSSCSKRTVRKLDKNEKNTKKPDKDFLDPLDLLEPVYEELTKEPVSTISPIKPKETKPIPMRRSLQKKLKKRKMTDEREESPPPVLSRKGTRSRPNRKVPKFYHTNDDQSTIVREPHTDQADPFMQLQEIKAEPLDLEENAIEIEENLVDFSENDITVGEEIMGDYDSPLVNFDTENKQIESSSAFTKIGLLSQPIIMNVESITETSDHTLKLINLSDIKSREGEKGIDPLEDPLNFSQSSSDIHVTSVQNVLESSENSLGFHISEVITEKEESPSAERCKDLGFQITNVISEKDNLETDEICDEQVSDILEKTMNDLKKDAVEMIEGFTNESASLTTELNERRDISPEKTEKNHDKPYHLENITNPSESTETDVNNTNETDGISSQKVNQLSWNQNITANDGGISREQPDNFQEGSISNSFEKLQLEEDSRNSGVTTEMIQSNENTDSHIIYNSEKPAKVFDAHGDISEPEPVLHHRELPKEKYNPNILAEQEDQIFCQEDQNRGTNSTGSECPPTVNSSDDKFDLSAVLTKVDSKTVCPSSFSCYPESEHQVKPPCHNDSSTIEFPYPSVAQFSRDNFVIEGFHIAQVVSEQIAQNEENKFIDQCGNNTSRSSEGGERYNSESNELETIVNDLSKIVGETREESNSRSNEDSSVIAESLENLLQD